MATVKTRPPTKSAPPPVIMDLSDFHEPINMLVHGDSGSGKTVLGGSAPRALIVAVETGAISARRQRSSAQVTRVSTFPEFQRFVRYGRDVLIPQGNHDWWVIDSGTKLQELAMRDILDSAHRENRARDLDTPAIQDYGKWQQIFKRYVNMINELPINVLWLAHSMSVEDEDGEPLVLPMFTGKNGTNDPTTMSKWMCGTVHLLGYLRNTTGDEEDAPFNNTLVIRRYAAYMAKDRYGLGVPWIEDPNMVEIQKMIESTDGATDSTAKPRTRAPRRG